MAQQARNGTRTRTGPARSAEPPVRGAGGSAGDTRVRRDVTHTAPAGQGLSDKEMARQVADQTSHDRLAESFFEEERGGARSDVEAAKFRDSKKQD